MGRVIALQPVQQPAPPEVSTSAEFIDEAYKRLSELPGFVVRDGQRQLSAQMAASLLQAKPFAAEAPTGTGKTIAYLVGALAAAAELGTTKEINVVVATATVGLQSQIMTGDLPTLVKAGILKGSDYALAKGRGRYFCIDSAERLADATESTRQVDFFDAAANEVNVGLEDIKEVLGRWREGYWPGDFDSFPGRLPSDLQRVAASSQTCLGHKCDHYNTCPFFTARRALSSAKVIVANHDLVLADLTMSKQGISPLFPGTRYLVVFDEAHHLPVKAQEAGSGHIDLRAALQACRGIPTYNKIWTRQSDLMRLFAKHKLDEGCFQGRGLLGGLESLLEAAVANEVDEDTGNLRFPRGSVPRELTSAANYVLTHLDQLLDSFIEAQTHLKASNLLDKNPALKPVFSDLLYAGAYFSTELQRLKRALTLFTGADRSVRWMSKKDERVALHSAPLDGSSVLQDLLWDNPRAVVAMTSATLRDFGGYERFRQQLGLEELETLTLEPIFPYHECFLYQVDMEHSPRQDERAGFEAELGLLLPRVVNPNEGTLVLFPSKSLMLKTLPGLRKALGRSLVRAQGEKGIKELIQDHRDVLDAGGGSVLCGLATMAEGLDLPGRYCTHVVVCALPFTVPTSPIEQELQEEMGRDYFAKKAMPDTLVKLIQMVGRLMRRESDRGRVTIFDNRTLRSRWGPKLVAALPPFKRRTLQPAHLLGPR